MSTTTRPTSRRSTRRAVSVAAVAALAAVGGTAAAAQADAAQRIQFSPGATSTPVSGDVTAGGEASYVVGASAGQEAEVHFEGPADSYWTLVAPDGSPLHTGHTEQQEDATVTLPRTGDYALDVQSATAGSYELDLTIPAPIRFSPGATSKTVTGDVSPSQGTQDAYSFRARGGQQATVDFSSRTGKATWTLVAPDGSPLHTGMTEEQGHASVTLPASGVYDLVVSNDAEPTYYELTLGIAAG